MFQPQTKLPKVGTTIFTVMSQLATEHGAVNLGQGFPDFAVPQRLVDELDAAMRAGHNQYAPMTGVAPLRQAIAEKVLRCYGRAVNPDTEITVTSGATEALFNAIHAVENREGERWIRIATRNVPEGVEVSVTDNGPGISPEILPRLFQPFQTRKSTGFGLGLAICSDILSGLKATIAADPPHPGQGATFRVHFPCPPPSS